MFDIIISDIPVEESAASLSAVVQLFIALAVAFLVLVGAIWTVVLLARFLRRNASKVRISLGETKCDEASAVPASRDALPEEEK